MENVTEKDKLIEVYIVDEVLSDYHCTDPTEIYDTAPKINDIIKNEFKCNDIHFDSHLNHSWKITFGLTYTDTSGNQYTRLRENMKSIMNFQRNRNKNSKKKLWTIFNLKTILLYTIEKYFKGKMEVTENFSWESFISTLKKVYMLHDASSHIEFYTCCDTIIMNTNFDFKPLNVKIEYKQPIPLADNLVVALAKEKIKQGIPAKSIYLITDDSDYYYTLPNCTYVRCSAYLKNRIGFTMNIEENKLKDELAKDKFFVLKRGNDYYKPQQDISFIESDPYNSFLKSLLKHYIIQANEICEYSLEINKGKDFLFTKELLEDGRGSIVYSHQNVDVKKYEQTPADELIAFVYCYLLSNYSELLDPIGAYEKTVKQYSSSVEMLGYNQSYFLGFIFSCLTGIIKRNSFRDLTLHALFQIYQIAYGRNTIYKDEKSFKEAIKTILKIVSESKEELKFSTLMMVLLLWGELDISVEQKQQANSLLADFFEYLKDFSCEQSLDDIRDFHSKS